MGDFSFVASPTRLLLLSPPDRIFMIAFLRDAIAVPETEAETVELGLANFFNCSSGLKLDSMVLQKGQAIKKVGQGSS